MNSTCKNETCHICLEPVVTELSICPKCNNGLHQTCWENWKLSSHSSQCLICKHGSSNDIRKSQGGDFLMMGLLVICIIFFMFSIVNSPPHWRPPMHGQPLDGKFRCNGTSVQYALRGKWVDVPCPQGLTCHHVDYECIPM